MITLGTRPEAIKLIPLIFALRSQFQVVVVSSGQHDQLLHQVLDFFQVGLDYDLGCMNQVPNLEKLSANIIQAMGGVMTREKPDLVIGQGDTMTVYQTAYVAFLQKIPFIHLEAGLRTGQKFSPFPEEMFRLLVGRLADIHLAPTGLAKENLLREGVAPDRILVTGNTVIDALLLAVDRVKPERVAAELSSWGCPTAVVDDPDLETVLLTVHRRENIQAAIANICRAVLDLAIRHPRVHFVWALHKNPEVRGKILQALASKTENIHLIEPVSYESLVFLMKKSRVMMTDSGGIQEESPTFGKPVIVLRESTERPEVVEHGFGFVAGPGVPTEKIVADFERLYADPDFYASIGRRKNPFGDGRAADRIIRFLLLPEVREFIASYPRSIDSRLPVEKIEPFAPDAVWGRS